MGGRTHDLAALLRPVSLGDFFANHWENTLLFIQRGEAGYYQDLLTNRDLEDIISTSDVRYPALRLAKGGAFFPPEAYTKDMKIGDLLFQGVPDIDIISAEYGKGATIAMPALHRTWGPLRTLCAALEEELDHSIHANVYITPGQAAGFTPHYDTHDVLVLQLAGRKRWRIDEPTIKLPQDTQGFNPRGFVPGARLAEVELAAGDLLYLPRGYGHSTTTSASHSAHVTIGINVFTWVDVVKDLIPACVEIEDFRRALPAGFASRAELRPAMTEQLIRLTPRLPAGGDHGQIIDQFILRVKAARPRIAPRFRADVVVISAESLLQSPPAQHYHIAESQDCVALDFEARKYVFPPQIGAVLNAMLSRATFRIAELPAGIQTDVTLSFARYLQGIGFLRAVG